MLAVLTMLLKYDMKKAIGTSVLVMTFTALVVSVAHFILGGTLLVPLIITSIAAMIGANLASKYVIKIDEKLLNRVVGIFLLVEGISLIIVHYFI